MVKYLIVSLQSVVRIEVKFKIRVRFSVRVTVKDMEDLKQVRLLAF